MNDKKLELIKKVQKFANKKLTMGCIIYCDDYFDGTIPETIRHAFNDGLKRLEFLEETKTIDREKFEKDLFAKIEKEKEDLEKRQEKNLKS